MRLSLATIKTLADCGCADATKGYYDWLSLCDFQDKPDFIGSHRLTVEGWYVEKSDTIQVGLFMEESK